MIYMDLGKDFSNDAHLGDMSLVIIVPAVPLVFIHSGSLGIIYTLRYSAYYPAEK